jgi:dimethylargininase
MRIALTRAVSRSIADCEVTFVERAPIDVALAEAQHAACIELLRRHNLVVLRLPAQHALPDAVFVEDPVVVVDEVAVALRAGATSRRPEVDSIVPVLERFREVRPIEEPGTIDGGDVLAIGHTLFAGRSQRTNDDGISQLASIVRPHGYDVIAVDMHDCLHLKSGCTFLGRHLLINPDWIDASPFGALPLVRVASDEPDAGDVLRLDPAILMAEGFPATAAAVRACGYAVETLDISEFRKAEAGVTCLSVIFEATSVPPDLDALIVR